MRLRLLTGVLALTGCDPRFKCGSNAECAPTQVCMRINPSFNDDGSRCVVPCTRWSASSAECDGGSCYCPDSPAGARCTVQGSSSQSTGNFYCGP